MFARGVDFSNSTTGAGNRAILTYLAPRLMDSSSAGTGVVILSSIQYIGATTCIGCANQGHAVFLRQLTVGNAGLFSSRFGTVPAASMANDGTGTVTNPYTDPSVRADGILLAIPNVDGTIMNDNQIAYISETYFTSTDFDISGFLRPGGIYARAIL